MRSWPKARSYRESKFGQSLAIWCFLIREAGRSWTIPVLIALGLAGTAAEGIGLGLLVFLLQLMLGTSGPIVAGSGMLDHLYRAAFSLLGENIVVVASVTVGLIVTKSLLIAGYNCLSGATNARLNDRLRRLAFARLLRAEYALVSSREHGYFQNLVTTESLRATDGIWTVFQMLVSLCAMLAFGVMLLLISWQLVVLVIIGTLVASGITRLLATRANLLGSAFSDAYAALTARVSTVLGGLRVVRAFGGEDREIDRFNSASAHVRRALTRVAYLKSATGPVSEGLYLTIFVGIVAASSRLELPLASVITFVVVLGRMQPQMKNVDWCRVQLSSYWPAFVHLAEFLDHPPPAATSSAGRRFEGLKECICFRNVSFTYEGSLDPALRDVSFSIPKGRTTAIVGSSGSGKSTITNLLLRLYEPEAGQITADGIPIYEFEAASWRGRLALAGQDADLIDGTILENVRYGRPEADRSDLEAAAERAGILEFIASLPASWDTRVGERGLRLSGGQRQRLSLARALLRNADLIILDEATNALDSMLEIEIQAAIEKLSGETTLLVIAHRLSTIMGADQVVVMQDGIVTEQGPPMELLEDQKSLFNRLYAVQSAIPRSPACNTHVSSTIALNKCASEAMNWGS